jgi:selenocysteine-specific elongation factor
VSTPRKNIMLGTAGHVDHGKTALVKLLTGCNTDTLKEEQQRGLTIDLGFAPCRLAAGRIVGIVDVPGHVDFIRNMVAGAHGIDIVMLVVAADDGVMPQTREHLNILTLMGLKHGLVALTKIDLVEADLRELVIDDVRQLLTGTFLEEAPVCPVSNVTGEGFEGFYDTLNDLAEACESRPASGLFRVWVADAFTIRGSGTVITGIPTSGSVRQGDHLTLLPGRMSGRVRRLQVYGEDAMEGRAGECVALNLSDVEHVAVRRGMVLAEPDAFAPTTMAEAELRLLDSFKGTVEDYAEVHVHTGTAAVLGRVAMLEAEEMLPGQRQMVQLRLAEPLVVAAGDRFVVRANVSGTGRGGLTTVGGGRILGTSQLRLRRKRPWTLRAMVERCEALDDPVAWAGLMLREAREALSPAELARVCGSKPAEAATLVAALRARGQVVDAPGGRLVHLAVLQEMTERLVAAVRAFHDQQADRLGMDPAELVAAFKNAPQLMELALGNLLRQGRLVRNGAVLALPDRRPQVSAGEQQLCDQVEEQFKLAGWAPPTVAELVVSLGLPQARVEKPVLRLIERGTLVKLDEKVLMHQGAIDSARQVALNLFAKAPSFSTMDFRDALGVSRKFAVPLLDYLDATRFTVRDGHSRTPGAEAKKAMHNPPKEP